MNNLIKDFLDYIQKDMLPETKDKFKLIEQENEAIITTFLESPDMNTYSVAMVFSYTLGMVYFYLSTPKPESVSEDKLYRIINDLNIKHKISNTSFMVGKNNTIILKFIDLVMDYSDIIYILQTIVTFADNELF